MGIKKPSQSLEPLASAAAEVTTASKAITEAGDPENNKISI